LSWRTRFATACIGFNPYCPGFSSWARILPAAIPAVALVSILIVLDSAPGHPVYGTVALAGLRFQSLLSWIQLLGLGDSTLAVGDAHGFQSLLSWIQLLGLSPEPGAS